MEKNFLFYNLLCKIFLFETIFCLYRTALKREDVEFSMPLHEARTGKENEAEVEEGQEDKVRVRRSLLA
jgi:hypothetical protein